MNYEEIPAGDNELATRIIGAAIEVHSHLGLGFIEGVYEDALRHELLLSGILSQQQEKIALPYKDIMITRQRFDLLVAGRVLVELKCVEQFAPWHQAQLVSYLKSLRIRLGLLINFRHKTLKEGVKRIVV